MAINRENRGKGEILIIGQFKSIKIRKMGKKDKIDVFDPPKRVFIIINHFHMVNLKLL